LPIADYFYFGFGILGRALEAEERMAVLKSKIGNLKSKIAVIVLMRARIYR
jgi:hypothetical protein